MAAGLVDPVQIVPGLFLGSARASKEFEKLVEAKISLIVNCAVEMPNHFPEAIDYIHLQLEDEAEESVLKWYQSAVKEPLSTPAIR